MEKELNNIRQRFAATTLGDIIVGMSAVATKYHNSTAQQAMENIASTYGYMKQYMRDGMVDEGRKALYHELLMKSYKVLCDMLLDAYAGSNTTYNQARSAAQANPVSIINIAPMLAQFTADIQIASLNIDEAQSAAKLNSTYFEYQQQLFNTLYTIGTLSQNDEEDILLALLSSCTAESDVRIMISALMLAQQCLFDIRKFRIFSNFIARCSSEELRQYALVAMMLSMPNETDKQMFADEINRGLNNVMAVEGIEQQLADLQLQILLCADTRRTEQTINNEIMPSFRKSALKMEADMLKEGKDKMEELMRADINERSMQQLEDSIERMRKLQSNGADVFFANFAHAKRFPFFYKLINWFVPFSANHPQIASLNIGNIPKNLVEKLMDKQNFCDSDQYSFYLTLGMVHQQIPKEVVDMLEKGEAHLAGEMPMVHDVAFKRRMYLHDLYRFYNLYTKKTDFHNPFEPLQNCVFFKWKELIGKFENDKYRLQVVRQLVRIEQYALAAEVLSMNFNELDERQVKLKAIVEYRQKHYLSAMHWFDKAMIFEPENMALLEHFADSAYLSADYSTALSTYKKLVNMSADGANVDDYEYRFALSALYLNRTEEAMQTLFKLNYLHEDNGAYRWALAWGHMQQGDMEKALELLGRESVVDDANTDYLRIVAMLKINDIAGAIACAKAFVQRKKISINEFVYAVVRQATLCKTELDGIDLRIFGDIVNDGVERDFDEV